MSIMKETKPDAIDTAPSKLHQEMIPQGESVELAGAVREPYGPDGMSLPILRSELSRRLVHNG